MNRHNCWLFFSEAMKAPYDQGFHLEEIATISMFALLDAFIILFAYPFKIMGLFVLNLCCIASVISIRAIDIRIEREWFTIFRDWFVLLLIIMYMEHNTLIPQVNPYDVDDLLIRADRFLFAGHDPTVLMERFTYPIFTEILQITYASFYFLPVALCFLLYVRRNKIAFHVSASAILIGFYISYIGYYLSPAIGPRFTLNHVQSIPLDGLLTFHFLRSTLDQVGGITRDCYPSGHALVSVLTVLLARRYYRPFAKIALAWTMLLLISTVYLRYHYFVDIIAGIALAVAVHELVLPIERYILTAESSQG
jgi:membrane-associated phospholipid phosphatase